MSSTPSLPSPKGDSIFSKNKAWIMAGVLHLNNDINFHIPYSNERSMFLGAGGGQLLILCIRGEQQNYLHL